MARARLGRLMLGVNAASNPAAARSARLRGQLTNSYTSHHYL
jgi:hypothetical protein